MKRFLWAAILALFIHIILLAFGGRFLNRKIVKPLPQTLSFTLVAEQPKPEKAKPLKATAQKEIPAPVPEKKALPPEAPLPPVIEETVPVPEEKPEPEEVIEKEEPPKAEPVKEKPPAR